MLENDLERESGLKCSEKKVTSIPSDQITKPSQLSEMNNGMKKMYGSEFLSFDPLMTHAKDSKRDGLLVSPCERLPSCPAEFTCSASLQRL